MADSAPPWAMPGDLAATLYLTANCGLWLALLGDTAGRATKAAGYLQTRLDEAGRLPSFLHAHWLAGGLWYRVNWQKPAARVFDYLGQRMNDLAPGHLALLITTLSAAGIPPGHDLVNRAASLLGQSQEQDGHWPSEDGPGQDVHSTLEAIRALRFGGQA